MRTAALTIALLVSSAQAFAQTAVSKAPVAPRGYRALFAPNPRLLSSGGAKPSGFPAQSLKPLTSGADCRRTTGGREDANGIVQKMLKEDGARFTMLMLDPSCKSNRP